MVLNGPLNLPIWSLMDHQILIKEVFLAVLLWWTPKTLSTDPLRVHVPTVENLCSKVAVSNTRPAIGTCAARELPHEL